MKNLSCYTNKNQITQFVNVIVDEEKIMKNALK